MDHSDIRNFENVHAPGDHLILASGYQSEVRVMCIDLSDTSAEAKSRFGLSESATQFCAEMMVGNAFMAHDLKNSDAKISSQLRTKDGSLSIVSFCNSAGEIRVSCTQPDLNPLGAEPFELAASELRVIKTLMQGHPYTGIIEMESTNLANAFAYYLKHSEQRASMMRFAHSIDRSGRWRVLGLFVELLPFASEETIERVEKRARNFPDLEDLAEDFDTAEILDLFLGDPEIRYLERQPLRYYCPCSKSYFEKKLISLGAADLTELAEDAAGIDLHCDYCGSDYHYSQTEIRSMLDEVSRR
ncbi:MAG: Hsp33 family molecular chaperone HslO [Eubacteriales bacterium]|nr:Hsp33 family molecular chaperone HslO [Eubacteriales bacterium]